MDESVEVDPQRLEPEARVDQPGPLPFDSDLEIELVAGEHELLQVPVSLHYGNGGGAFVNLPGLYSDKPVLDVVDYADAVAADEAVEVVD